MKKKLTNLTIVITLIIIIIATIIINKNKIEAKQEEYKNITNYLIKKPDVKSEYIAVIQIPKLNFQKGIYSFDEEENNYVEERLNLINTLKRKYGNTIEEILNYKEEIQIEIQNIENLGENNKKLRKE